MASLPDGLDPDEIVARNRDEWAHLIENAKPIVEHVMNALGEGRDLNDHKVVNEIADQVLPLIQDLPHRPTGSSLPSGSHAIYGWMNGLLSVHRFRRRV